jgi:hypothetical protein
MKNDGIFFVFYRENALDNHEAALFNKIRCSRYRYRNMPMRSCLPDEQGFPIGKNIF